MDFREKNEFLPERGEDDHLCLHESDAPSDWQFDNQQVGFLTSNLVQSCQDDEIQIAVASSSSSAPMVGSLRIWGGAINLQEPSFSNVAMPLNSILPPLGLDLRWNPLEVIPKGIAFSQNGLGVVPPRPSWFPADSAFIKHAARVSCFNGIGVGGAANPFCAYGSSVPFSIAHKNDENVGEAADGVSMPVEKPAKNVTGDDSIVHDDFSIGGQDEAPMFDKNAGEPPSTGFSARKKKKRGNQGSQDQAERNNQISVENLIGDAEVQTKEEQNNLSSPDSKPCGKYGKDSAETPKEDYVHVRARRGQATNSHSLAERVRRERISERMKFLQDLVPGCSKITGKAVMLDEIINYVQSLQRQVEFLSMKLAAVNPPLDVNVEQLLSREILQSRTISSSMIGFSSDVLDPQLHLAPQAFGQPGFPVIRNPSHALKGAVHTQLISMNAYREQPNQISSSWDNRLQSVVQMEFGGNAPHGIEELHGLPRPGHTKVEP